MVALSNPSVSFTISSLFSLGSPFAWKVVLLFYVWAFVSLKVPSNVFKGPATPNGYVPLYSANGLQFYFVSLVLFLLFTTLGYQNLCTVGNLVLFFFKYWLQLTFYCIFTYLDILVYTPNFPLCFGQDIYHDFSSIVQVLNLTSMLLCAFLVYKGKNFPETQNDPLQNVDKPLPYLFYRGIELHPRIFGVDVKQVLSILGYTKLLIRH